MKKANAHRVIALGILCCLNGCYTFTVGSLSYKTIGVPVANNATSEYRATDAVTKALIAGLVKDGRLKVIEPKDAQSRLDLDITGYKREPYVYNRREVVAQYKVTIIAKVVFRGKADKAVWRSDSLSAWSAYAVDTENEGAGIEKAASNLAAEIIRQAFEAW
ncbi:MAG: LPS assembly lipoprotein LptE [Candidatus Edwardsbacteria bacterium]|nr:LPS assembly lipoprotein LptE [Candidatus Edwardsbacteria bacterium]